MVSLIPISRILREAAEELTGIGAGNPYLEAEYLLQHALGWDRVTLLGQKASPAPAEGVARFQRLLDRRLAREPLQYILGTVPFCDLELRVGAGALIPRSETEILVEQVARAAASLGEEVLPAAGPPVLLDLGTGTGAILLALLHRLPGWRGVGIDRSAAALSWARSNVAAWNNEAALIRGDWAGMIRPGCAQVVVSNPPYIRSGEMASLAPEIREHEPVEALEAGEDGMRDLRGVVRDAFRSLVPGGLLGVECAPDQAEALLSQAGAEGAFTRGRIFHDLAGRARGILAYRGGERGVLPCHKARRAAGRRASR